MGYDQNRLKSLAAEVVAAKLPPPGRRRRILDAAGVSYREGAEVLGVTPMTLLRWQHGICEPRTREMRVAYGQFLEALEEAVQ